MSRWELERAGVLARVKSKSLKLVDGAVLMRISYRQSKRWVAEDWEGRGPQGCLMNMVDDATNTGWARLGEQETIWAAATLLRAWIERHGVPLALYVDWKNVYQRAATTREQLRGEEPITQFGRMCA